MGKMPGYKRRIFARAILVRCEAEQATPEVLIEEYPKLQDYEKKEILEEVHSGRIQI